MKIRGQRDHEPVLIPARTARYVAEHYNEALTFAHELMLKSRWFVCTPLPDDEWEFIITDE